jgi:hypothetical protein
MVGAKIRILIITDAVRLIAASLIIFWLFTEVILQPQPAWINFWALFFLTILTCVMLSRIMNWMHGWLFK